MFEVIKDGAGHDLVQTDRARERFPELLYKLPVFGQYLRDLGLRERLGIHCATDQ
jgi:hypothetical protein